MGLLIDQSVTRPHVIVATWWAGLLPQIVWMNEHKDVLEMYVEKTVTKCVASDDGTTMQDHVIDEYEWCAIGELDAVH